MLNQQTDPVVALVNAFDKPYNNAIATARTCYASRVILAEDVDRDDKSRQQRDAIGKSTFEAGHHTILQHAHFQFILERVSRQCVWSFLHAHAFYNSEQVSQRYVAVKPNQVYMPALPPQAAAIYQQTVQLQTACYAQLVALLLEPASEAYFAIFKARRKHATLYASAIRKKAQEVARYCLPIATYTHLYHTISGLTLYRYYRLSGMLDVPHETQQVIQGMADAVRLHDPLFFNHLEDPIALEKTHEYQVLEHLRNLGTAPSPRAFRTEFDVQLRGKSAALLDYSPNAEHMLARSVRSMLGITEAQLSDDAAIAYVLSPAHNAYLSESLNLASLGKLMRCMQHPYYTFQKKLSHAADSQDQRHRLTPGTRPVLQCQYVGGEPDVVIPTLLSQNQAALDCFLKAMQQTWQAIDCLLDMGIKPDLALYLLPNAFPIRFEESGSLAGFHHKWTTRLCYNAQEEIWQASKEEVDAVAAVHPRFATYLLPPCGLRQLANTRPLCPEGQRYCGVPVWKLPRSAYERLI